MLIVVVLFLLRMLIPILDSAIKANRRFRQYQKREGGERRQNRKKSHTGHHARSICCPSTNSHSSAHAPALWRSVDGDERFIGLTRQSSAAASGTLRGYGLKGFSHGKMGITTARHRLQRLVTPHWAELRISSRNIDTGISPIPLIRSPWTATAISSLAGELVKNKTCPSP
jgi:hypothetical protein